MDRYQQYRETVLAINAEVKTLLRQSAGVLNGGGAAFNQWESTCDTIARQLNDHVVRIAVVGAIKSGKSTLVNALLQGDYLKRGAGVVTSIVTRLRQGEALQAKLYFKSWDEVNAEVQQALVLFPTDAWRSREQAFDIRRGQDRRDLQSALDALDSELRIVHDSLNANGVLLASYLKGYDQVQAFIADEGTTRSFDGNRFADHRDFVGNDALAVFLRDIELAVPGDVLAPNMEMADCQGSDSPNPLHLAMIQDYLLKAHLVLYVISSRTGLRQADIRFLSIIKRMGIAGNMLFVVNCDLNEHEGMADLKALVQRIREELSMMVPDPQPFVLSALYALFDKITATLPPKDQERLNQWRKAETLSAYSTDELRRLRTVLDHKLTRERSALLLQNQLARIAVTLNGLRQWLQLNRDLLRRDTGDARDMAERLQIHQDRMSRVEAMIQSTLDGAIAKISRELKAEVDRFFDPRSGALLRQVLAFVRDYRVDLANCRERLAASGFTHTLYWVFQELKQALDGLMAEKINPEIVGFVQQREKELQEQLHLVAEPYEAMVRDALARYEEALEQFGLNPMTNQWTFDGALDLASIKNDMALSLPPAAATMRYSAAIKTEAVMRLGFYALVRVLRKVLKKSSPDDPVEGIQALKDGVRRMKRETERAVIAHFKDYKENLKFQYIQPMTRVVGNRLYDLLTQQFTTYVGDVQQLAAAVEAGRSDKALVEGRLADIEQTMNHLRDRLASLRDKIDLLMNEDFPTTEATA
ncbi:dynamin family protein [Desulfatitalea alkaliphila]|uniref:Dynamin family protein n=1 Tax=Desulfatitalea alkaliphila TaxID=2929485 RepID=A0AA41R4F3_9BACT|nr:dynamin family protein [Desulfatitalea alkaliphila]MCJ8500606.1 dynamin family protein [Desulfatitalea alkaliphila]